MSYALAQPMPMFSQLVPHSTPAKQGTTGGAVACCGEVAVLREGTPVRVLAANGDEWLCQAGMGDGCAFQWVGREYLRVV